VSPSSQITRAQLERWAASICDVAQIEAALAAGQEATPEAVRDILFAARAMEGLSPAQTAILIQTQSSELRTEILHTARHVHQQAYGRRIGLFAPVCPTNRCVDDCLYCPLRRSNAMLRRTMASPNEIQKEVKDLLDEGHRRLIIVTGNSRSGVPYLRDMIEAICGVGQGPRRVQRVDLNIDPLSCEELQELKHPVVGTYHVYQETYHPAHYAALHPPGPKADYVARLTAHDQAARAGWSDLGLGLLLGAGPYEFDLVALVSHAQYLHREYGLRVHTVSLPRMIPAKGAPASQEPQRQIDDETFLFIVAVIRLALPFSGLVLNTPASTPLRRELYATGISEVMTGASSYPGVYTADGDPQAGGKLIIGRPRPLETLIYRMCEFGFVPNLCTACYGRHRREAWSGSIAPRDLSSEFCAPGAVLALKEYLIDHASAVSQPVIEHTIQQELARLPKEIRTKTLERLEEIEAGIRDSLL